MDGAIEKPKLLLIAQHLDRHDVAFIVIGGQAAVLLGSPLATLDVNLCYQRTERNLENLANALRDIHPRHRGAPPDLPFRLDARSLALGSNFTFMTDLGPLDLLGWVDPIGSYDELLPRCEEMSVGEQLLRVISLDDLIAIKRHIGRAKDRAALAQLEAIKKLREGRAS
jgi:predicted nucleotidyltransferase